MAKNELILPGDNTPLPVPEARNKGAEWLFNRLDNLLPHLDDSSASARKFIASAIAEANKMPADVEPLSVSDCVFNAACLGLVFGQRLGHIHMVPFGQVAQLIIGYKGFLELAYRPRWLRGAPVVNVTLEGEEFEHWNDETGPHFRHKIPRDRVIPQEVAAYQNAYCQWTSADGQNGFFVVYGDELQRLAKKYTRKGSTVWRDHPFPMACKTPVLRAGKMWKQTEQMANAMRLTEQLDNDERQERLGDFYPPEPQPTVDLAALEKAQNGEQPDPDYESIITSKLSQAKHFTDIQAIWKEFEGVFDSFKLLAMVDKREQELIEAGAE